MRFRKHIFPFFICIFFLGREVRKVASIMASYFRKWCSKIQTLLRMATIYLVSDRKIKLTMDENYNEGMKVIIE